MVLRPRDDPLVARDTETSGDAVLFVLVARVGFETTCGLVVPQPDGAVVCGGEDVSRVGRELDVLAGAVWVRKL